MKLYGRTPSGNSHKVRLCLKALKLDCGRQDVTKPEQQEAWFLQLNPFGQVPVLEDQGLVVTDSLAILEYLAITYDQAGEWLPQAPGERARVMAWLGYANSTIHLGLTQVYLIDFFKLPGDRDAALQVGKSSLDFIDRQLNQHPWLCGKAPSLADLAVYPYLERVEKTELSLEPFSQVRRYIDQIKRADWYVP